MGFPSLPPSPSCYQVLMLGDWGHAHIPGLTDRRGLLCTYLLTRFIFIHTGSFSPSALCASPAGASTPDITDRLSGLCKDCPGGEEHGAYYLPLTRRLPVASGEKSSGSGLGSGVQSSFSGSLKTDADTSVRFSAILLAPASPSSAILPTTGRWIKNGLKGKDRRDSMEERILIEVHFSSVYR